MEISEVNVTIATDSDLDLPPPPPPPPPPALKDVLMSGTSEAKPTAPTKTKGGSGRRPALKDVHMSGTSEAKPAAPTKTKGGSGSSSSSVLQKRPRSPALSESPSVQHASSKRRLLTSSRTSKALRKVAARHTSSSRKRSSETRAQTAKSASVITTGSVADTVSTPPRKVKSVQKPPSVFRVPREQPRRCSLSRSISRTPARKMTIKQRPVFSTGGKLAAVRKLAQSTAGSSHTNSGSSMVRSRRGAAALKALHPNTAHLVRHGHPMSSAAGGARRSSVKSPKSVPSGKQHAFVAAAGSVRDDAVSHIERNENDAADDGGGFDIYVPDDITEDFFQGKTFFVDGDCLEVVQLLWKLKARVAATFADPNVWAFIGRASVLLADDGQHQRPAFKYENARRMRAVVQTLNERKTNFQLAKEHGVPLLDYDLVKQAIGVLIPHAPLGAPKSAKLYSEPPFLWLCDTELEYKPEIKCYRLDAHDRPTLPTLYLDYSAPVMSPFLENYPRDGRVVYLPPSGRKDVPRAGYCEICNRNYDRGMTQHVYSEYHLRKLRHTDFNNLDNLFKAIDAEEGRESSIFDVLPESPIDDGEPYSSPSSPFSRDVEMEICAPVLSAARQQPQPSLPPTTAVSSTAASHARRHQGAFRSVLVPLGAQNTQPHNHSSLKALTGNTEPSLSRAYVPQLHPVLSPNSQSHTGGMVTRSRSRLTQAQHVPVSHQQLQTQPHATANYDNLGAASCKDGAGTSAPPVPPSTARSTSSFVTLAREQNAFLPANLFNGTSSEKMRAMFDLTPPSTEITLGHHMGGVAKVPQPNAAELSALAGTQHAELSKKHVSNEGQGSRGTGHGPFGSLLRPGAFGLGFEVHAPGTSIDAGQRKSARYSASEEECTDMESEPTLRSPCPAASMTEVHTATKGALSPLSALQAAAPSKPSDTTPSFPSPPSFAIIKRKRGSPLPSIMLSGSTHSRRSPRVLQQRDKNTLCVPSVHAPTQSPPSGVQRPAKHLKFSSSSPTGFYSKTAVPVPSSIAAPQGQHAVPPPLYPTSNAKPRYTPRSAFSSIAQTALNTLGAESSSEVTFPLKPMLHHFTSSPVFTEALLSADASRRQSNGRAPSSSRLAPRVDSATELASARTTPSGARQSLSSAIVDENTLPPNLLATAVAASSNGTNHAESSATGVASAFGVIHVSAPSRPRGFKVASSSSSSGLVSPQHRKKRRRKDNRMLFRSSSVDHDFDGATNTSAVQLDGDTVADDTARR